MKTLFLFSLCFVNFLNAQIKTETTIPNRRYGNLAVALDSFEGFTVPPLSITVDFVFKGTYSFEVGIGSLSYAKSEIYGTKTETISGGPYVGANYYLNNLLSLDMDKYTVSAGAGITYISTSITIDDNVTNASSFGYGANIRGRYFFIPN